MDVDVDETSDSRVVKVTIPEDVDLEALSELLPDFDLTTPTEDAVLAVYRLLLVHVSESDNSQRELDEARAEVERKEVELDQALQDRERIAKDFEGQLVTVQHELVQVKQERDELVSTQAKLQADITRLSSTHSASSVESGTLKHRLEDVEREKRDLVGVLSRVKEESSQQEAEITTLRSNLKEARQEHQTLESQIRELRSNSTSMTFKVDTLSQQLQLSQAEAQRANVELTAKSEEFAKYRRERQTELVSLQSSHDALSQSHSTVQASLKALQTSHHSQTQQLSQALVKIQDLTGQLAEQEATYANEASVLRRLVSVMEDREKQTKDIVDGIEREWASVGDKAEERERILQTELDHERRGRLEVEKKLDRLEAVLENVGQGNLPVPSQGLHAAIRNEAFDGMNGLSPTVAMASRAQKTGKTFTEVYADYIQLQSDYAKKSAEYDHMDRTLSAVLAQIEERAPILSQQRQEYERLKIEGAQLSSQLAQAISDRDAQSNAAQENAQKLRKASKENEVLQQQLEDIGRQVQTLLKEIGRRNDPNLPSDEELRSVTNPTGDDVNSVITNHLVLFASIPQLQEQNQKLLKIVRELGQKMEGEEREYREAMEREQGEAIREAYEAVNEMTDRMERQKKQSEAVVQAYIRERDALKVMLERERGSHPLADGDDAMMGLTTSTAHSSRELTEMQNHFDAYRREMGVDSSQLREELVAAQREVGQVTAALAKSQARVELMDERLRMNQEQIAMHVHDIDDWKKRNQQLYDQWSRSDVEVSRLTEDLQKANRSLDELRNDCTNLKAEKQIWESVQSRLVDENKAISLERASLSDLMGNVQKMHNDLERSGEMDRRRLENQLHLLENQTQDMRTQLSQEREISRHTVLQKEIEVKELQNRLDRGAQELMKTRESLISAETSKHHLEDRVTDLSRQAQSSDERLAVYERRTSSTHIAATIDPSLSREQQLEAEVAEFRSALKVAELDLAAARTHVQQFKEISQASEAALAALNTTYDEYKASTEMQISRHEVEHKALSDKLEAAQQDVNQFNAKYEELQQTLNSERAAWLSDKKTLEGALVDLTTSEKNTESDRSARDNELRQQASRAKDAERKYSQEVVAHAESIKKVDSLRSQLVNAQQKVKELETAAQTAHSKLTASELSWTQQKEALDKELSTITARCHDLANQNGILHQHLESVSSQAARIRQAAESSVPTDPEASTSDDSDTKLGELRSVVAYLRKEKEIVELQLELSKQEVIRLKGQVESMTQTIDEARTAAAEERQRAADAAASSAQHDDLLERINQMTLLKESNATLRRSNEANERNARKLDSKVKELSSKLEPAQEEARLAKAELEARDQQLKRLEEESRKWQERNSQLLSKYDRIDPAEMQALKDEIVSLKQQNATLTEKDERIQKLEANIENYRAQLSKSNNSARAKMEALLKEKVSLNAQVTQLQSQITATAAQNAELAAEKAKSDAQISDSATNSAHEAELTALRQERDALLAERAALLSAPAPVDAVTQQLSEAEKLALTKARDDALALAANQKAMNERMQKRLQELSKARLADQQKANEAQQKAAAELAAATVNATGTSNVPSQDQLKALEESLTAQHQEALKAAVAAAKAEATTAAPATSENNQAATSAALSEQEATFKAKLEAEVSSALERGRMEAATKVKLKDAQLVRANTRMKELEQQVAAYERGEKPAPITTPTPGPSKPTPPAAKAPPPTSPATTSAATSSTTTPLPDRPLGTAPAAAGRGRGVAPGARGGVAARILHGRGGPPRVPPTGGSNAGVSIHGAAAKRPREETSDAGELAKRLKPAEPATAPPAGRGPPVKINRPPPET